MAVITGHQSVYFAIILFRKRFFHITRNDFDAVFHHIFQNETDHIGEAPGSKHQELLQQEEAFISRDQK